MAGISIDNISFGYDQNNIFEDFNLDIRKGQFLSIMGLSGSGKSTLLRILLGFNEFHKGEIKVGDQTLNQSNLKTIRGLFSYIPQSGALYPHLTCEENILLPLKVVKKVTSQDKKKLEYLIQVCGLEKNLIEKKPSQLSGGQRQRVAIVRALMSDGEYILLDEPFSALDSITKMNIQKEFREIFKHENKTIILVTHSLQEAAFLCDDIILLKNGKIDWKGSLNDFKAVRGDNYAGRFVRSQIGLNK